MKFWFAYLLLLWATLAHGQVIQIHGHPQKTVYVSPAEWPAFDSGQTHWNDPTTGTTTPCHVHIEPTFPKYGELRDPLVMPVQFQLFHCQGYLSQVWSDHGAFVLDQIGEWREYVHIAGDPNGVVVIPGKFYFNIAQADGTNYQIPLHGWTGAVMHARVLLDSGVIMTNNHREPFWSMRDPSAPEVDATCDGCGPLLRSENSITSPFDANINGWGASLIEFRSMIPIAPLTLGSVWNTDVVMFGYGSSSGLVNTTEQRLDMNLHLGIPGTLLTGAITFDTTQIGLGDHKVAFILTAHVPDGLAGFLKGETASTLETVPITVVDGSTPPATTCQDSTATNVGGPLPCTYPAPPPPPPINPWNTLEVNTTTTPTTWIAQCIDTSAAPQCAPFHVIAVCVADKCAGTSLIWP